MSETHQFLAIDLGAESGRAELITLEENKVRIKEIHRFANRPVVLNGTLYWDFPFQFAEILTMLTVCTEQQLELDGIGVDTWGVDFGLVGADGQLLSNPVHYRDSRTDNIFDYSNPIMPRELVFEHTGCEPWEISTLFQLLALKRDGSPLLTLAESCLNMPDLINFFLTGIRVSERTVASTANLMNTDGKWCNPIIEAFDLPPFFEELVDPGTIIGPLSAKNQSITGVIDTPVIATCSHDTSAVVASIPAIENNWAFISSGTWSILGMTNPEPVISTAFLERGFTNEYTLGGWFSCKNIIGLWLIQELRRQWDSPADPWDYNRIVTEASNIETQLFIDVSDPALIAPADMESTLLKLLGRAGHPAPDTKGELIRCILESLALEYATRLESLCKLSNRQIEVIYIVGGGSKNQLLNQLTANATGIPVFAGVDQCTALGNALTQAKCMGIVDGGEEIRGIIRNSFELESYQPESPKKWEQKRGKYRELSRIII